MHSQQDRISDSSSDDPTYLFRKNVSPTPDPMGIHASQQDNTSDSSSDDSDGEVEAGTVTTIDVTASAYDLRPGGASGDVGCGETGCLPALARDGATDDDDESRWSCAKKVVADGGQCEIEFTFESPQDILDVQVAFWKGDERTRTLKVSERQDN